MSVSVDKYFGWTIDLKTDLNCNDFDFYHKFIDKHPNLDQWKNCMPNEIKLILDGMNGLFARLVYVLSVSYDVAWVDEDNDILNDTLKENNVPENIFKELNTIYTRVRSLFDSRPAVTVHFPAKGHKQELNLLQKKACFRRIRGTTVNGVRLIYANIYFTADGSRIYGEEEKTIK